LEIAVGGEQSSQLHALFLPTSALHIGQMRSLNFSDVGYTQIF